MALSHGWVVRNDSGLYLKLSFDKDSNDVVSSDIQFHTNIKSATVFSQIPSYLKNCDGARYWFFEEATIEKDVKLFFEWYSLDMHEPRPNQKVKVKVEGIERKALYNESLGRFIDYSSMNPIEVDDDMWKEDV